MSTSSFAQKKYKWVQGKAELLDGEKFEGKLIYRPDDIRGLIQLKKEERILTYSPFDVSLFSYYDKKTKKNRVFHSLPIFNYSDESFQPEFLELLFEGELITVFKQHVAVKRPDQPLEAKVDWEFIILADMTSGKMEYYSYPNEMTKRRKVSFWEAFEFKNPFAKYAYDKRLLTDMVGNKSAILREYTKKEELRIKQVEGLVKVLAKYHELMEAGYNLVN
ncbi:hypothetical protein AAG747_10330 [Rapidithrix thailandica]|uniref:Uncharacterized protein n=1 Tax=Rapidithrix thailandica TaxID=413964 RepID=A0AAW9RZA1_9BACT